MIRIFKKTGETPLTALRRFRRENPVYKKARLSYAGRLDPMAEGELLLLEGEENDRREEFLGLDKTYEFEILFGVRTDSFDLLGIAKGVNVVEVDDMKLQKILAGFEGEWQMRYPPYSSKTVEKNGRMTPLWQLARAGELPNQLPDKIVEIYDAKVLGVREISADKLLQEIETRVREVEGDFRQSAIEKRWKSLLESEMSFQIAKCRVSCSAGTYVRRLAHEIGRDLGTEGCAFSIKRTSIEGENK